MTDLAYKSILAPTQPAKGRGDLAERMEQAMTDAIQAGAAGGWTFVGTQTLEMEVRTGLFRRRESRTVSFLVFSRERAAPARTRGPEPVLHAPEPTLQPEPQPEEAPQPGRLGPAV